MQSNRFVIDNCKWLQHLAGLENKAVMVPQSFTLGGVNWATLHTRITIQIVCMGSQVVSQVMTGLLQQMNSVR